MYDFNFADLLIVSKKNWKLVGMWTIIGLAVIGAVTVFLIPQKWSASASIALGNQASLTSNLGGMLSSALGGAASSILSSISQSGPTTDLYTLLLESWDTRRRVVEKCGLQKVMDESLKDEAIDDLSKIVEVDAQPPASCSVTVYLKGTPRGLFPSDDKDLAVRQLAVRVVNAYTEALQQELQGITISPSKADRIFLQHQMPLAKAKFDASEAALAAWEAKNHLPSPTTAGSLLAQELITVIQNMVQAQVKSQADERSVEEGQRLLGEQKEMVIAASSEALNPQITALTSELAATEQQISQQEIFYHKTAEHPDVQQLLVQKQKLLAQLGASYKQLMLPASTAKARNPVYDTMRGALVAALVDKAAQDATAQGLQAVLNQGNKEVEVLAGAGLEYVRLYENVVLNQTLYETITKNYEAALLTEKAQEPIFFVVDPPVVPYKKASPSTLLAIVAGLFLGMCTGVGLAFRKERRAATLASAEV